MSNSLEDLENQLEVRELLVIIANNLILMNAKIESAFETGIELEDITHGDQ